MSCRSFAETNQRPLVKESISSPLGVSNFTVDPSAKPIDNENIITNNKDLCGVTEFQKDENCHAPDENWPSLSLLSPADDPETGISENYGHYDISHFRSQLSIFGNVNLSNPHDDEHGLDANPNESAISNMTTPLVNNTSPRLLDLLSATDSLEANHENISAHLESHDSGTKISDPTTLESHKLLCSQSKHAAHSEPQPEPHSEKQAKTSLIKERRISLIRQRTPVNDKILEQAQRAFVKICPSLQKVTAANFCGFLIKLLRTHHRHIPLDSLFDILYSESVPGYEFPLEESDETDKSESKEERLKAIILCRLVLKNLQAPYPALEKEQNSGKTTPNSSVNYHEFLRTFLAMKIIFASVNKVEDSELTYFRIPKRSLYQVYFIICQKLLQQSEKTSSCANQSVLLGISKFCKITKLIFPKLQSRRLGKRGSSKSHYIGLEWNKSTVSQEILQLLKLDIPELKNHFKISGTGSSQTCNSTGKLTSPPKSNDIPISLNKNRFGSAFFYKRPPYSYVNLSHTYPDFDCSPRVWNTIPNSIPQQSKWARSEMESSLKALKSWNIDLTHLIQNFGQGNFSKDNEESLLETVYQTMITLQRESAPNQAYLHLYFVILAMIFPVVMSSDTEVNPSKKAHFRAAVESCVATLQSFTSSFEDTSLQTFVGILKKMLHLNKMSSCKVKTSYSESILMQMIDHMGKASTIKPNAFNDISPLEEIFIRGMVISLNSYDFKFVDNVTSTNHNLDTEAISLLAKDFKDTMLKSKDDMSNLPKYARLQGVDSVAPDVPFRVLQIALRNLHEVALTKTLVLNLPMAIITYTVRYFFNWMQSASFYDFQKVGTDFAKECFKCCWVFTSMYQEYIQVISEVVALSNTIASHSQIPMRNSV